MNPRCPEPKCHCLMRTRKLKTDLGISGCPKCKSEETKPYILTKKKKGMRRCSRCHTTFVPKRREGFSRFFVCPNHSWQKFQVGNEIVRRKERPKNWRELLQTVGTKKPFQAIQRRQQPNVMRPQKR